MKGLAEIKRDNAPKADRSSLAQAWAAFEREMNAALAEPYPDLYRGGDAPAKVVGIGEPSSCPTCGKGLRVRHLTELERNTLASIDDTWTSTMEVVRNAGGAVKRTAMIARLTRLAERGLVEKRLTGRHHEWRRLNASIAEGA